MRLAFKTKPEHIGWDHMLATWQELDADERYDSAWTFDHFYPIYGGDDGSCLESWVTLGALAQATTRIRVGSMVNAAPYRNPGLFAAMASTLDIVSGGRLELGLGCGWNQTEAGAIGIDLGSIKDRQDRFSEYLQCVRSLLSEPVTDFAGRFYTLTGARNEPKGPQQPAPPIVIGGSGPKRTMPLVARHADHWNLPGGGPEDLRAGLDRLAECCDEIGRDPAEIVSSTHIFYSPSESLDSPVAEAEALKEAGLDIAILYPSDAGYMPESVHDVADAFEHLQGD